ncbi:hypothetical protein LWI29_013570 [Acer saccharum]|uniref:Uncharacterized protein n=1 Tax=Acer saccharum TaxID=4024 RepID=A0AA39TBP0_ACESA|nr:hypothetical protein LWI29_013570 [Acer saccharum]
MKGAEQDDDAVVEEDVGGKAAGDKAAVQEDVDGKAAIEKDVEEVVDRKPFIAAMKRKFTGDEADIKALKL